MSALPSFHDWLEALVFDLDGVLLVGARAGLVVEPRAITSSGHGLTEAACRAGMAGERWRASALRPDLAFHAL